MDADGENRLAHDRRAACADTRRELLRLWHELFRKPGSLEAQHEACRAFILSQKHEGWIALNQRYDNGGFSGGTTERPGLEELLRDVKDQKVDAAVPSPCIKFPNLPDANDISD